jgi:ABC-2 type transport system ATP-binding protein
MSGGPAIAVEGLTKYYGAVIAIEELTFEVRRGEVYGFLGANGAGKTTTIRLLVDLLRPSRGRASILGVDCHADSLAARRLIGYLPGDLPIYPDLSAADYLAYLSRLDDRPVPRDYLDHLLRRFDVSPLDQRRRLREQSHGMKQKIGIIQALMMRPAVAILDEPTAGLDPLMVQAFRETVAELRAEGRTTVFLSSHVLAEVEDTCDRIGLVRGGRLVTSATIDDVKREATRRVTITFADGSVPLVTDVRGPVGPLLASLRGREIRDV